MYSRSIQLRLCVTIVLFFNTLFLLGFVFQLMIFGFMLCLDCFLFMFTFLPLRLIVVMYKVVTGLLFCRTWVCLLYENAVNSRRHAVSTSVKEARRSEMSSLLFLIPREEFVLYPCFSRIRVRTLLTFQSRSKVHFSRSEARICVLWLEDFTAFCMFLFCKVHSLLL